MYSVYVVEYELGTGEVDNDTGLTTVRNKRLAGPQVALSLFQFVSVRAWIPSFLTVP